MPQNKQWIIAFSIIDQSSTTTYTSATVIQFISAIYAFFCILSLQRFKKFCTCKGHHNKWVAYLQLFNLLNNLLFIFTIKDIVSLIIKNY